MGAASVVGFWPTPKQSSLLKAGLLPPEEAVPAWRRVRSELDLEVLEPEAVRILPLVYRNLQRAGVEDPEWMRLKGIYRHTWARNQLLLDRTAKVLAVLSRAEIPTLILKGIALIGGVYRDPGTRSMIDIDLLVAPSDLRRSLRCLKDAGWEVPEVRAPLPPRFIHGVEVVAPDGTKLDLHWRLMEYLSPGPADNDGRGIWTNACPTRVLDQETKMLAPEYMLVHALVHGCRWTPERDVRWIADSVRLLSETRAWDVDHLVSICASWRCSLSVAMGLRYVATEFGSPLPTEVLPRLEGLRHNRRERLGFALTSKEPRGPSGARGAMRTYGHYVRLTASWRVVRALLGFPRFLQESWNLPTKRSLIPALVKRLRGSTAGEGAT